MLKNIISAMMGLVGAVLVYLLVLLPKIRCTTEICAMCTGYQISSYRGIPAYYPLFEYEYKGKRYQQKSMATTRKKYLPLYEKGTWHRIWIDDKRPQYCLCTRDYTGWDIYLLASASFFFVMCSFMTIMFLNRL